MYYVAKVQMVHEVETPKGVARKKFTETYLIDAMSVTEAEKKVVEDFRNTTIEFEVKSVNQSKIVKIIE